MTDLIQKTKAYAMAVHTKNYEACLDLYNEDAIMSDPLVSDLTPKSAIAAFYKAQFEMPLDHFAFKVKRVFQSGDTSFLEFTMEINDTVNSGVDVIDWKNGKIQKLYAYVNGEIPEA